MSKIQEYLKQIGSAVYGKDVRQSIIDAIKQCYTDNSEGLIPVVTTKNVEQGVEITITVGTVVEKFVLVDGYIPVKGKDYWTDEDKEEIQTEVNSYVADELAKRGQIRPEFANSIEECTDTSKLYVLPDGFIYAYVYKEDSVIPHYTNQIPISTDANGNIYNDKGYDDSYTGFIPCVKGDILRFENCDIVIASDTTNNLTSIATYDASYNRIASIGFYTGGLKYYTYEVDSDGKLILFDTSNFAGNNVNAAFIKVSRVGTESGKFTDESIITVNEEITKTVIEGGYHWMNTGHAFVPADYEAEINELQSTADSHNARITVLENNKGSKIQSVLTGKKLVACGDSITDAYDLNANNGSYIKSYAELTAERNGMTFVKNAVSGSTMAYNEGGESHISTNAFSNTRYKNLPEFDYLTLFFGWNDKAYSTLGTINDTDNTTFYGAYKTVLDYIITNNPTKKIGIVVPYGPVEGFAQAVRDIAELYGVPCLDLQDGKQCSLIWGMENDAQLARRNALTFDTTHPNQDGHIFLSTMYEEFLKRL